MFRLETKLLLAASLVVFTGIKNRGFIFESIIFRENETKSKQKDYLFSRKFVYFGIA